MTRVGIASSTYLKWVAILNKNVNVKCRLYIYDTKLTKLKFGMFDENTGESMNYRRLYYNFTSPILSSKIQFERYISHDYNDPIWVYWEPHSSSASVGIAVAMSSRKSYRIVSGTLSSSVSVGSAVAFWAVAICLVLPVLAREDQCVADSVLKNKMVLANQKNTHQRRCSRQWFF